MKKYLLILMTTVSYYANPLYFFTKDPVLNIKAEFNERTFSENISNIHFLASDHIILVEG